MFWGTRTFKMTMTTIYNGRALFKYSKFYILDEPTASIDPIFDRMVLDMFLDENNEDTCIIITHRLENLKAYNPRIIVFSEGKIIEKNDKTYNFSMGKAT